MEASRTLAARAVGAARSAGRLRLLVLLLGAVGGVLVALAELSTIVTVDVLTAGTCEEIADPGLRDACNASGFEQHGGAFLLLGLVAIVMAFGAARGGSRPAAAALLAIGGIVLAFSLLRDLPKANETGRVGIDFEAARAMAGTGLYLEIFGGLLTALAGALALLSRQRAPAQREAAD